MTGFELRISGAGSDCSTNWAKPQPLPHRTNFCKSCYCHGQKSSCRFLSSSLHLLLIASLFRKIWKWVKKLDHSARVIFSLLHVIDMLSLPLNTYRSLHLSEVRDAQAVLGCHHLLGLLDLLSLSKLNKEKKISILCGTQCLIQSLSWTTFLTFYQATHSLKPHRLNWS